ncbi:septation protein IspZ [Bacteriovorax sp. DB6_IX]|uniref:septation protein IspZ n=1 Tax=Bacteriovorax sp. DB6_IX TaxID=1353530 RepID=UPI00038A1371|nr:septation protein IspZ [Bacteriovorax sp. DB6_IX]EQC52117.1 intracellular septation protein A [Bacteriovorax sp. DB6_IX]
MKKNIFLLSFIPALVYWYLEETQTIEVAVIGGLSLAVIEVLFEKIFTKHVHSLSKMNLILLLILGPISLIGKDGIWFKLQPFFTGVLLFGYLMFNLSKGESLLWKMTDELKLKNKMPEVILKKLEKHLAYFLLAFAFFMAYLAKFETTSTWAFFKTIGFYIVFAVFMLAEVFVLRKSMREYLEQQYLESINDSSI